MLCSAVAAVVRRQPNKIEALASRDNAADQDRGRRRLDGGADDSSGQHRDQATGWGSVNLANLAADWAGGTPPTSTPTTPAAPTSTSTPGTPPTATSTPVPPSATSTPLPGGNVVVNPGFESGPGVGWTEYSSGHYELIDTVKPHTGSYSADLCGYNSCTDLVQQTITVPSGANLTYWWDMASNEGTSTPYDRLRVQLYATSGTLLATLRSWDNTSTRNAWSQDTLSLAAYAGQTVTVRFVATTDASLVTRFFLDDIVVP
jgi:hypothetical protein